MNDYWHIPRASLASSSAASSSAASLASSSNRSNRSTNSNPPTLRTTIKSSGDDYESINRRQNGKNNNNNNKNFNPPRIHQTIYEKSLLKVPARAEAAAGAAGGKRGSRSSQGSSESNNSTRSAASGSLLLTAANLERFAEIHKKQTKAAQKHNQQQQKQQQQQKFYLNEEQLATTLTGLQQARKSGANYNANLAQALAIGRQNGYGYCGNGQDMDIVCISQQSKYEDNGAGSNDDTIITMDPNLDFVKSKDLDTVSIASSMHFTMVNGEGGPPKKPKRGLCDRGRQVTVLIVSMSTIFLLLIMGMVYALEMRAREMPQS